MANNLKAFLYEITIITSSLEHAHGMDSTIYEIYIPKLQLFFNHTGIYKIHTGRYKNAKKLKVFGIEFQSGSYIKQGFTAMEKGHRLAKDILNQTVEKYEKVSK